MKIIMFFILKNRCDWLIVLPEVMGKQISSFIQCNNEGFNLEFFVTSLNAIWHNKLYS